MVKCPVFATERLPQLREQAGGDKPLPYGRIAFAADGTGRGTSVSAVNSLSRLRRQLPHEGAMGCAVRSLVQ